MILMCNDININIIINDINNNSNDNEIMTII